MADTTFTPGPWIAISRGSYGPDGEEADVHVQEWWDINGPLDDTNFMRGSYSIADAHLIAAAPDLYEALEAFVAAENDTNNPSIGIQAYDKAMEKAYQKAVKALAKTRGETV